MLKSKNKDKGNGKSEKQILRYAKDDKDADPPLREG